MSGDSESRPFSESLVLDDSKEGVLITGITDDKMAAKSGLQAGDEIVASIIHLDHLREDERLKLLKVLESYDKNMVVLTKKELAARADLGSLGLVRKDPGKMLNFENDLSLDASAEGPFVSLDSGKLNASQSLGGEIGGPTINGDLPSLSLNKPSADASAKFRIPSLGLNGPDIKKDLDGTLNAPNVSVFPKINTKSASLDIEKPEIKTGNQKYKAPKFTMPQFNLPQLKTPKADMNVSGDTSVPLSGNLETPNMNLSATKLDLESPKLDLKGDMNGPDINLETSNAEGPLSKIKWPHLKWKGDKIKGTDTDLNADLSAPNFSLNTPKMNGDISAPDVDINLPKTDNKSFELDVQTPNPDIDSSSGRIHWPNFRKKPKLNGPKTSLDLDANPLYVDPSLPKMEDGINAPDFDINLQTAELDMQTPNIDVDAPSGKTKRPHWKLKKPKLQGPKVDLDTPTIEGDINVPKTELKLSKADLSSPTVDFQEPDIDAPSGKINWPHRKWKKNKLHGPKADLDLSADLSSPDVDLAVPKTEGALSTPDVDLHLPGTDVDVKAPETGKLRFPTPKKPKFLLSGPKVKSSLIDIDADVKAPDLNLSPKPSLDGPNAGPELILPQADVQAPNLDIAGQSGKLKWTLKKPKGSASGPKIDCPEANLNGNVSVPDLSLEAPQIDGEVKSPDLPKADLKGPELGIDTPDMDSSGKLKWFNFKKPKFGTQKGPKGDIDVDVKAPQMDFNGADVNMSAPKIKTPKLKMTDPHLDINGPDINSDISLPKDNLVAPNLNLEVKDLTLSAPKMDFNAPDLDINVPKADLNGPGVDLKTPDFDASAGKLKLPKINLPKFGRKGPEVKGPNLNVAADNVNLPDVNLKLPKADVKTPSLNLSSVKGDLNTPDPDVDAALKTNIDLSAPNANVSVPDINVSTLDTKGSHLNLNLPQADVTGSGFDLPKADLKASDLNLKAPELSPSPPKINGNFSAPKIDPKVPKTEIVGPVTLKAPNMDINLPKADLKGPDTQLKTPDLNIDSHLGDFNFPHFKRPKLGLESPNVEVPSVSTTVEDGIEAPKVNMGTSINTPDLDITAEADAGIKGTQKSKFRKLFKWGLKSGSDDEETGEESETDVFNAGMTVPVFKTHKMPRNNLDDIGGIEDVLSLSKLDSEAKDYVVSKGIRLPIVNASTPGEKIDIMQRLRMAKEKTASANISPTEATRDTLKRFTPNLHVNTSTNTDSSLVRGGTFKVDKPDEHDKLSLGLSNMLGLNVKDSDAN